MLCSKCSAPLRPVVAIDIDGTMGDYHAHILEFADSYLGVSKPVSSWSYGGELNFGDWMCELYEIDRRTYREIKLAYRQGGMKRSMPVHEGAAELVEEIRRQAEVWITTSRPYLRLDNIDPDTRFWLDHHKIAYDHAVYDEHKYAVLAERVEPERVCAVLEDLPAQYDAAAVEFGEGVPILRQSYWNRNVSRPRVVEELDAARQMLLAQITDWKIKHEFDHLPTTS